jgi:hypothetical protein
LQKGSYGQSQYLIQAVSAHPSHCFLIAASQVCIPADVDFSLLVFYRCSLDLVYFLCRLEDVELKAKPKESIITFIERRWLQTLISKQTGLT